MLRAQVHLTLPIWIQDEVDDGRCYADDAMRIALAVRLARLNVERGSGGPFGAAIFSDGGRLIAVGVNRVVPVSCSVAHAETMAFMAAQARLDRHRLNDDGQRYILATSAQPCAMCFGATMWAGIDELLIGARAEDVTSLTEFDEGPMPADWVGELARRGIAVKRDLMRDEACDVLRAYGSGGGAKY